MIKPPARRASKRASHSAGAFIDKTSHLIPVSPRCKPPAPSPAGDQHAGASADRVRERLLAAAQRVFADKGFAAASMAEIAAAAGLDSAAFSVDGGTKQELYHSCLEAVRDRNLAAVMRTLEPATSLADFRAKIGRFVEDSFARALGDPSARKFANRAIDESPLGFAPEALLRDVLLRPLTEIAEFLAAAHARGLIDFDGEALILANIITGFVAHQLHIDKVKEQLMGWNLQNARHRAALVGMFTETFVRGVAAPYLSGCPGSR